MPLYYFNVDDGLDEDGIDLVDLHAARIEAAGLIGALMQRNPEAFFPQSSWRITITDHAGMALCAILFSTENVQLTTPTGPRDDPRWTS